MVPTTHSFLRSSLALSLSLIAIADTGHAHRRNPHGPGRYHGHDHGHWPAQHNRQEAVAVATSIEEQMFSNLPFPLPIETDNVVDDGMVSIQTVPNPEDTSLAVSAEITVEASSTAEVEGSIFIQTVPNPVETGDSTTEEPMFSILPFPNPIETDNVVDDGTMSIQNVPNPTDEPTPIIAVQPVPSAPAPSVLRSAGTDLIEDIHQIEQGLTNFPNDLLSFVMAMQDRLQGLEDVQSSLVTSGLPVATSQPDSVVAELPTVTELPEPTITDTEPEVGTNISGPPPPGYTFLCRPAGAGPLVPCPTRSTLASISRLTSTLIYRPPVPVGTGNATYGNVSAPAVPPIIASGGPDQGFTVTQIFTSIPVGTSTPPINAKAVPPTPPPTPAFLGTSTQPAPTYTFDASSSDNVAVYYGQTRATEVGGLLSLCQNPNVDIINLAFLFSFVEPRGYPPIDFGPGCIGPNTFQATQAPGLSDCAALAPEIAACQVLGKKVLVSLGGEGSNTSFTSDDQAIQLASTLWNLFGAGSGETAALRPFGPDVIIDGFDIDNKNQNTSSYETFATALREQFAQDETKAYCLSTAPDCLIPDPSIPLGAMRQSDFVWVQFYDNPSCELGSEGFQDSFAAWGELLASSTDTAATAVSPRLFVGVGAWEGAGSGYVEGAGLSSQISLVRELYVENLGGILLWDGSEGLQNVDQYGVDFLEYAKNALH